MPYNNSHRRVNSQLASNTSTRTVSYNSGGLNERFSKIVSSQKNINNTTRPSGPTPSSSSSVFSRLRGAKPVTTAGSRGKSNIQNRLGKTIGGGIKKKGTAKNGPTPMSDIVKSSSGKAVRGGKRVTGGKKQVVAGKKQAQKGNKKVVKKPATAEDLDRALDAYMMKDPKTAQAKLDADMESYMAEAEDILMDDNL